MDKYKKALISNASKLDAITDSCGEITKLSTLIVEENSKKATISLLKRVSEVIDNRNYKVEIKRIVQLVSTNLIEYYGYSTLQSLCRENADTDNDPRTLAELLDELDKLIGLKDVKSQVNDLIAYQKVQMLREKMGLHSQKGTLHLAFTGNPGTGKTTVARIVGRIYRHIGLLSKGHFVEVSRTDLVAGYQGQTALKVKEVIERAKGGVLFIDEAYSITENDHSDSYGRECLTELTKALEDYRNDLVVIVAGYTEPMNHFFASNPGLKSRFNTFIEFPDYSATELFDMLKKLCSDNDYVLSDDISQLLLEFLQGQVTAKGENFANGRLVRNIYEHLIMNHARRVVDCEFCDRETLSLIKADDFTENGEIGKAEAVS